MTKSNITFIFFVFLFSICFSQTKNEKEEKIAEHSFPKNAASSLKVIQKKSKKLSLYKETDNKKISYEAKFKYNKHHYSVEFSENGILEDVEIIIKKEELLQKHLEAVTVYLEKKYKKAKIRKIQKQFVFNSGIEQHKFINNILESAEIKDFNLEIIVEVKENKSYLLKEILFNNSGQHLSKKTIATSSYGHVLY